MKKMKALKVLALMLALAFCLTVFSACGEEELSTDATYQVVVEDAVGTPYSAGGIVVKFMQNGQQAAMQIVNESGVAEKTLPRGDYTVELQFTDTDNNFIYDNSDMTLSSEKTQIKIVLSQKLGEETHRLDECDAHFVKQGCTNITLSQGRNYYIFTPEAEGKYEVSLIGSDAPIGNYGGSVHYIWEESSVDVVDNKFTTDIRKSQLGGAVIIIGIDGGEGDAILSVQNIGAPDWSIEDEPWTTYNATCEIKPYTLPAGAALNKFDLTSSTDTYRLVLNEADGYYHLGSADGALVVVVLGSVNQDTDYVAPFETILEKQGIRRYFYEDDDTSKQFLKKEEYSECVQQYIDNMDEATGVYPLTDDLMYIIQQHGAQSGWFDDAQDNARYLFVDENRVRISGINPEISWLFMCRYL